jgi:hypothetical protein
LVVRKLFLRFYRDKREEKKKERKIVSLLFTFLKRGRAAEGASSNEQQLLRLHLSSSSSFSQKRKKEREREMLFGECFMCVCVMCAESK